MRPTVNCAGRLHHLMARTTILWLPVLLCTTIAYWHLSHSFTSATWRELLSGGARGDMHVAILYYSALPRLAVALLAGAGLGLASTVLQVVLRNPIAEPATLGISGGASLALSAAALWAPALLDDARPALAFLGAAVALLVVIGLALGRGLSPTRLILGGLIVSLLCGTLNALLVLFHHDTLQGIFIWNAGSLIQNDWHVAKWLSFACGAGFLLFLILGRALTVLQLEDGSAQSLGLPLPLIRLTALIGTLVISAAIASAVGVIGFAGLAATTMARTSGTRSLRGRLIASSILGAAMLAAADQGLQMLTGAFGEIPVGGLTALLGAPLVLWLLPGLARTISGGEDNLAVAPRRLDARLMIAVQGLFLLALVWPALMLSHSAAHWSFWDFSAVHDALQWRLPRTLAAVSAGFLLGVAGVLTQRLTGNPLASPEVLGISSGAALGALLSIFFIAQPERLTVTGFAFLGAMITLGLVFAFSRRAHFSPERMLLAGIAVSTLFSGVITFLLTTGDPRLRIFMGWMAGSISRADIGDAWIVASLGLLAMMTVPFLRRWLEILPMGAVTASSLGLNGGRSRSMLLLIIAALTAAPTMVIGPLSFVGLMSPHIVRMAGIQRPVGQCFAAGAMGALIVLAADLIGRTVLFPYEIPAGLMASLVGAPYFLWLMQKRR